MKKLVPAFILKNYKNQLFNGNFEAFTMFIDISGFTAMTQSLMRNGKEGAEILTLIINKIFTPSIDAIYENGGFISTFAGDAFTAIFPLQKSNAISIIHSAVSIQRIFREIGLQRSRFGEYDLSVKIGLSFGKVDWKIFRNKQHWKFKCNKVLWGWNSNRSGSC